MARPKPAVPPDQPKAGVVRVAALGVPQRRRAGRLFGPQPTEIPAAELSAAEIEALQADPYLQVEIA